MQGALSIYADEIKQAVDMRQVMTNYGISVNAAGYAVCPFHNERTASLKVYERSFYCFGCGVGGDVIRFVRSMFGIGFPEAVEKLNSDFSIGLPIGRRLTVREARNLKQRQTRQSLFRAAEAEQKKQKFIEYLDLLQEEERLLRILKRRAPASETETPNAEWFDALHRYEYIGYLLDNYYLRENAARKDNSAA